MRKFYVALTLLLSMIATHAQAADSVGKTIRAEGQTKAERSGTTLEQRLGDPVFWQDILQTGASSRMEVRFDDGTELYLGDASVLSIDELVYEPQKKGQALFTLSQGVFRMVSGAINKMADSKLTVRTPLATIGVRGTDFWGLQSADKLTMALLDDGELEITTDSGTFILTNPREAIVIEKGKPTGVVFTLSEEQIKDALKTIQ